MLLEQVAQDARIAIRGFRRSPRFAASAILTIALAIGAVTAVFSVADRSLREIARYFARRSGSHDPRKATAEGSRIDASRTTGSRA